ncbi:hypothetical protein HYQ46_012114 [Verticillium longisporum]|nr:hypothetical protein HYQ46_012114 [Verticillium longisporum]
MGRGAWHFVADSQLGDLPELDHDVFASAPLPCEVGNILTRQPRSQSHVSLNSFRLIKDGLRSIRDTQTNQAASVLQKVK